MHQQVFGSPPSPNRAATSSQRSGRQRDDLERGDRRARPWPPFWTVDPTGPVIIAAMDDRLAWLRTADRAAAPVDRRADPRRRPRRRAGGAGVGPRRGPPAADRRRARPGRRQDDGLRGAARLPALDGAPDRPGGRRRGLRLAAGGRSARLAGGGGSGRGGRRARDPGDAGIRLSRRGGAVRPSAALHLGRGRPDARPRRVDRLRDRRDDPRRPSRGRPRRAPDRRADRRRAHLPRPDRRRAGRARSGRARPPAGGRRPLRPAGRARRARPRPAPAAGGRRGARRADRPARALRVGRDAGAGDPARPAGRRPRTGPGGAGRGPRGGSPRTASSTSTRCAPRSPRSIASSRRCHRSTEDRASRSERVARRPSG